MPLSAASFLAAAGRVLDLLARLFHLLTDLVDRLVDVLAGALGRAFLLLAGRKTDDQGAHGQCRDDTLANGLHIFFSVFVGGGQGLPSIATGHRAQPLAPVDPTMT